MLDKFISAWCYACLGAFLLLDIYFLAMQLVTLMFNLGILRFK